MWRYGDRLALVRGQLQPEPQPTTHADHVADRRAALQPPVSTAWISFFARVRARTSWSYRANRRRIARVH